MPKTVKEAAERVRNGWPKGYESLPFETCTGTPREWQIQYGIDTELLAQEYLDQHPADEDEPLTFEKAEELLADSELLLAQRSGQIGVSCASWIPLNTVGELRRLCSALGIPLTPETSK